MTTHCDHTYVEEYYGHLCTKCGVFYPFGGAPWDESVFDEPVDPPYDDWDDDEDYFDCGWVRSVGVCIKAGSEDCDFDCPFREEAERAALDAREGQT